MMLTRRLQWAVSERLRSSLEFVQRWGGLAACLSLGLAGRVSAQVYTFFPVLPVQPAAARTAAPQPTGPRKVTLVVSDSTLEFVVDELARQAHLQPMYVHSPVFGKRMTVHVVDAGIMDAFANVLHGTGLAAKLASDGQTVVISDRADVASETRHRALDGSITGRVTDSASGQGLGGAQVRVAGIKSLSSVTSDSGNFTLRDVPSGDQVLTVRLFGYKPAERTVTVVDSQRTTVHIVMVSVPTVLSGVVTTASGLQRKIEVGNDITTINVDSVMQTAPVTSVTDLLETRVPGLTVLHSDGVPGDPSRIRLRGAGSLQLNNDPIVIVDGVRVYANQSDSRNNNLAPGLASPNSFTGASLNPNASAAFAAPSPLDQIDPNSIATIEVFKGPSASALYGSDAASGVIVITTKHGQAGPAHWSLDLGQGVNWLPGSWPVNDYRFGTDAYADRDLFGAADPLCPWYVRSCMVDSLVAFQALNDPRYGIFSHGSDQTASLTVSGGHPDLTYSLTGSAAGDIGNLKLPSIVQQEYDSAYGPIPKSLVRPDNYTTYGINGSISAQPSPNARVTLQSSLFNSTQQRSSLESAILQLEGEYLNPTIPLMDQSGNPSPLIQDEVERATSNSLASTNAMTLQWTPVRWLPINATGGLNTIQRTDNTYVPFGVNSYGPGISSDQFANDTTGSYGLGRGTSHDQTFMIGTAIPARWVTLAVGGNVYSNSTADFTAYTQNLAPGVSVPTLFPTTACGEGSGGTGGQAGNGCSTFTQSITNASTYGWYLEPRLNLSSRFFAAPGFRFDGGSGASTSAGSVGGLSAFPKIDLSYVAVDRQQQRPLWGVLTLLRPRLAFGLAGTQPGAAAKLRLFNIDASDYTETEIDQTNTSSLTNGFNCRSVLTLNGTTFIPAVCLNSLGNTQLRPERSTELEGGFDATLWQGRLTLTYTQYNKTRHDAILDIPVAPSVSGNGDGSASYEKNVGVIQNTGTEVTANLFVLQNRAFSWNVGANLSNNRSLVVRLNPGDSPNYTIGLVPGYPLFSEWQRPIVGFADVNHDGIIEPDEVRYGDSLAYVGQQVPKYELNLTTDMTMLNGRLSVHATFAYQNGLTQNDAGACNSGAFALLPNAPNTPLALQAAVAAAGCTSSSVDVTNYGLIQTVNTFRFNDLSINYQIPRTISTWFRVPRMTLALQGSNLALHTNYRGLDPDVNAFSTASAGDQTEDNGQIPEPRTWWLKVSVGN